MQRHTIIAEIFGYLVCLIAVVVFFASVRGIVNSAFHVGNPDAHPHIMIRTGMLGHGHAGNAFYWTGRGEKAGPAFHQLY